MENTTFTNKDRNLPETVSVPGINSSFILGKDASNEYYEGPLTKDLIAFIKGRLPESWTLEPVKKNSRAGLTTVRTKNVLWYQEISTPDKGKMIRFFPATVFANLNRTYSKSNEKQLPPKAYWFEKALNLQQKNGLVEFNNSQGGVQLQYFPEQVKGNITGLGQNSYLGQPQSFNTGGDEETVIGQGKAPVLGRQSKGRPRAIQLEQRENSEQPKGRGSSEPQAKRRKAPGSEEGGKGEESTTASPQASQPQSQPYSQPWQLQSQLQQQNQQRPPSIQGLPQNDLEEGFYNLVAKSRAQQGQHPDYRGVNSGYSGSQWTPSQPVQPAQPNTIQQPLSFEALVEKSKEDLRKRGVIIP